MKSRSKHTHRRHRELILLVLPAVAFFMLFNYGPMIGLVIAFKEFMMSHGILRSPWVGMANFRSLFASEEFPRVLRNTAAIGVLRLTFGFFVPILLALMLNEVRVAWFKRGIQTLTYLPYFFSWVILGGIFLMLLGSDGPLNALIQHAGHSPVNFLSDGGWFLTVLIVTAVWQSAGYAAVIHLAALVGIDPGLYEAAAVDGAGRWRQTLHVTLPCLVPTIVVLLILSLGGILSAGFDQIYNMYNPMVYDVADIIDTYVVRRMQTLDYGLAAAAGMFKSVVGLVLVVVANWLAKRISNGEQGIW